MRVHLAQWISEHFSPRSRGIRVVSSIRPVNTDVLFIFLNHQKLNIDISSKLKNINILKGFLKVFHIFSILLRDASEVTICPSQ